MRKFRQLICNWMWDHNVKLKYWLWLEPKRIPECNHPVCQPSLANPEGICLNNVVGYEHLNLENNGNH